MHPEESCSNGYAMQDDSARMRFFSNTIFCCQYRLLFIYGELTGSLCCCRRVSSSNNLYQESATVMLWYVTKFYAFLEYLYMSRQLYSVLILFLTWSKYVTVTWNWRIHYWMVAQHLGWKFVILDILRYQILSVFCSSF